MLNELAELWHFRYLLSVLVKRDLKVRYKNSALGFVWSIAPTVLQLFVFSFFFHNVLNVKTQNFSAYVLCGLIPWGFLSAGLLDSSQSLLNNYAIIRKIYLPREIIPLASVMGNFIHFILAWTVYFVAFFGLAPLIGIHIPILPTLVWFPFITLAMLLFVTGLALWVSALNVFYQDVKFMLQTGLVLLFFMFPVIYPIENVYYNSGTLRAHPWLFKLYQYIPINVIIESYRKTILQPVPRGSFGLPANVLPVVMNWKALWVCFALSSLIAYTGYWYFNRRKWQFVERP
ncbi:MAG TPA: ABC transporter permease [Chthonomonadaceae bacterium]|nr:ABC transporter permease [Chthonomonadaceae bacterium]